MAETNMMDEKGNFFVPMKSHTNPSHPEETFVDLTREESVDEPPQESEHIMNNDTKENAVNDLQEPSERNTEPLHSNDSAITHKDEVTNHSCNFQKEISDDKTEDRHHGCSQDKVQEPASNFITEPQTPDICSTDGMQMTEDKDRNSLSEVKSSETSLTEDTVNLSTKQNHMNTKGTQTSKEDYDSIVEKLNTQQETTPSENNQGQLKPISNTTKNEEEQHLTSKLLVLSNQTKTEDGHQDSSQEKTVAVVTELNNPKICSETDVKDGKESIDNLPEINSSDKQPSNDSEPISTKKDDQIYLQKESMHITNSEEVKTQQEVVSPTLIVDTQGQTQPMCSATETEIRGQLTAQENVLQTQNSSQNRPEKNFQRTISMGNVLEGNADDHSTVGQPKSKSQPTTKQDQLYPLRNIKEDKDYKIVERLSYSQAEDLVVSDEGEPKLQGNAKERITKIYGPKMTEPEPKDSKILKRLSDSQAEDLVVSDKEQPKRQVNNKECITESYISEMKEPDSKTPETRTNKAEAEHTVHHQIPYIKSCTETKAAEISKCVSSQSMAIQNDSTQLCPEPRFQGNVHPDQIDRLAANPININTPLSSTGIILESKPPENKMSASKELVQTEPQKEMSPKNDDGFCNTATVSKEPNKHDNTETTTEPQQGKDNLALEITDPKGKDVNGKVTQTENDPHDTFPTEVSPEKKQNTKPVAPVYPELSDFQDHLYEEADDIGLQEDPYIRQQVERLDHVSLNIAVTGMTGAGKSTFINAIRGFDSDDENAAPTGVTETTMDARPYPHPSMPNVTFWDLPGTGSPKFKVKKYLKDVKFETYDFFIIISSERFKENDVVLAREILKKKRKFYFLRSKIDNDLRSERHKKNFDEEKLLNYIREDCIAHLQNVAEPRIFLVSSFDLNKYDFPQLVDTLLNDLPEHKRGILTLSLPIYSTVVLERKIKAFENTAQSAAKAAGHISVAPIPGLAMACDAGILLTFFTKCYNAFGLDDKSLDKLSARVNNPSLKSLRESRPLVVAVRKRELSNRELSALGSKRAALEFAYSLVPVWGSKKAASMAHSATLDLLNNGLKELADTAREVLKAAKIDHIK